MTNIENNTDKRSQQLSTATGLTTQSARNDIVKQASAAKEAFLENMELGKKIEYASQQFTVFQVQIEKTELRVSSLTSQIRVLGEELNKANFSKVFDTGNEKTEAYSDKFLNLYKEAKEMGEVINEITNVTANLGAGLAENGPALAAIGLAIKGIEYVIAKYIAFKNEVEAATKAMDFSTGSLDQQTQAIERKVEALERLKEEQSKIKLIDEETRINLEALKKNNEEIRKAYNNLLGTQIEWNQAYQRGKDSGNEVENLKELEENLKKAEETYKKVIDSQLNEAKAKKIEIEFSVKKENIEKDLKEVEGYLDKLDTSDRNDIFIAFKELGKDVNYSDLVNQYMELERNAGSAAEKAAKLKEIQDRLKEDKEIITRISFQTDQDKIKELEKIGKASIAIDENTQLALYAKFEEIRKKFDEEFKDDLPIKIKLEMQNNFYKDVKELHSEGLRIPEVEKTLQGTSTYIQLNNNKTTVNTGNTISDEIKKIMTEYEKTIKNASKLADGLGLNELDQAKSKLSTLEKAYTDLINKGADGMAKKLIPEIEKLRKETEELNKEDKVRNLFKGYREELEKSPTIAKILGLDEEAQLKQKITNLRNLLVGLYNADGTITDKATFEKHEAELKALLEEEAAAKKMAEMKKKEENAMKDLVSVMNNFGGSLIAIGQGLNSSFLENTGNMINTFSSITNGFNLFTDKGGLGSITGMFKGGMADSVKGLESITGVLTSVSGMITGFNVAKNLISSLGGSKAREQIDKNNEANKEAFRNSTTVLLSFTEAIKANISAINSYSSTLLGYATNNTTLSGIAKVEKNFDHYISAMVDGTKDFGTVTGLVKSKTKYKSWFKSKSADTYEAVEVKEADILKSMGITNTTIDNMDENQLRDFAEKLKTTGRGDLLISLVDSNFEEWKEGVFEYVAQLDKLREEQNQLLRNSTLNAFEGIDVSSYKSLVQEYIQMFEDMGLNADAYKDTIEEMARNAQVLVTAMQDVRSSFIEALSSGETSDFSSSMSSYFKKILNNAAQVTYDVAYSSIDEYMTKEFEKISEKLVDMKKNGVLDFNGFWDDFNFNKILEADRITTDYEKIINDLRSQLENRGFSSSLIDSMLPATELSERIDSIKNMLSSAMSEALDNNSFASFEESLGNSIYESVKDSLIQAFVDSEVYRTYMNQFYNMDDIKEKLSQAANAQQGFGLMQDYLKDLEYELEKMGLNKGNAASGNSTEDNTLGNSYYQDSGIEYNITIEQHFSGVYGFDAMYDVAKQGATEAIEEWKNRGKIISTI